MAYSNRALTGKPQTDLLGVPILSQYYLAPFPMFGCQAGRDFLTPAAERQVVDLRGTLPVQRHLSEFASDGRFVAVDDHRTFALVVPGFIKRMNLVSLFSGKLHVALHRCFSSLIGGKHGSYRGFPFVSTSRLAFARS